MMGVKNTVKAKQHHKGKGPAKIHLSVNFKFNHLELSVKTIMC